MDTKQLKKDTKQKKKYLSYYEELKDVGKKPMKYGDWKNKGSRRTQNVSSALESAGLSQKEIKKLRGK